MTESRDMFARLADLADADADTEMSTPLPSRKRSASSSSVEGERSPLRRKTDRSPPPERPDRSNIRRRGRREEIIPLHKLPAAKCLSLCGMNGPKVDIYLKSDPSKKYTISRDLLFSTSDYFIACLSGPFIESSTQTIHLSPEIEATPFELILQYILTGDLYLDLPPPPPPRKLPTKTKWSNKYRDTSRDEVDERILARQRKLHNAVDTAIKVVELAQSLLIEPSPAASLAYQIHPYFEDTRIYHHPSYNPSLSSTSSPKPNHPTRPLPVLLPSQISQTWKLFDRYHPFRLLLSRIAAQQYIMQFEGEKADEEDFDFDEEMESVEGFARDVLVVVKECMREGLECRPGTGEYTCMGPMLLGERFNV